MPPLIEFKQVAFAIGDRKIIDQLNLSVDAHEFVVILGGNGSGKSTLIKLINQTYRHTSGDIFFKQKSIDQYTPAEIRGTTVTLTQFISESIFLDLTILENAILIESTYLQVTRKSFCQKTFSAQLPDYLSRFNPKLSTLLKTRVKNLSGGEQQMLAFALYLRHQPDVLLLDEHTSALDPKKSDQVMEFTHDIVQKNKLTCLMTTHELNYALQYGTRLIAIHDGKIIFDVKDAEKKSLSMTDLLKNCY